MDIASQFADMKDVALAWLLAAGALGAALRGQLRCLSWDAVRRFAADEGGASYALPYVLTFPFYLLVVCVMIQASMIFMVKIGTLYAAHAAARAAVVWRSDEPEAGRGQGHETAENKAEQAAVFAMTPLASAYRPHLERFEHGSPTWGQQQMAEQYYAAYRKIAADNIARDGEGATPFLPDADAMMSRDRVMRKYRFATAATRVVLSPDPNRWNADVTAIVAYRMPMHVPGAGRILGEGSAADFFARRIETRATIPSEVPKSANGRLGIGYDAGT